MPTPDSSHEHQSSGAANKDHDDRAARLAAVRSDLVALVADVKRVVEAKASNVKNSAIDGAEAGVDFSRNTIRAYPIPAVAMAAVVGAVMAMALTPAARQQRPVRLGHWAAGNTRANLEEMAQGVHQTASSTGTSLLSAFERVVESVSKIDPKSSLTPTLEKAATWLNSLR